ncbi:chemosensory receptor a [Plakobranchus ocellatus]|uniref:Chemosensory receptor a n=1 Tax=Plakobranchus ocellatus TaxID=259542 RepID=A0AAV3YKJ2_9GAST|nr:chemosensory receptor a [Plakobranchus ocellatus]
MLKLQIHIQSKEIESPTLNSTLATSTSYHFRSLFFWTSNILTPSWPALILLGLSANVTNIAVFLKTGVKDSITILLLSLSMSDLLYLILMTPKVCSFIIFRYSPDWPWPFDINICMELFYWPAITCYDFSAFMSVWLGVTRCACVAMPLQFKSVFTKARTVKLIVASLVVAVSLRMPIISVYRVEWRTNSNTNTSFAVLAKYNRAVMTRINDILNRNSILYINFIIMIACVSVLSVKLYQASRIRRSCISAHATQQSSEKSNHQGRSSRDLHVIQSVVLPSTVTLQVLNDKI